MAQKDYVKRPQAKKAPNKRNTRNTGNTGNTRNTGSTRKKAAVQNGVTPWMKITIAVAVIALFVFGLYRLGNIDIGADAGADQTNDSVFDAIEDTSDTLEQVILEKPVEQKELPIMGDEDWEYIDSLPEYSVEVDATGPLERKGEFILQCGSFRTIERAETLRAKIAFQGLEAQIIPSNNANGLWYRVVLGPVGKKRTTEQYRRQLRSADINGCRILG